MHWHFNPVCHDSVTESYGSALATSLNCRPVCLLRQHRLPQSHRTWNPGDVNQPEPVCSIFFPRPSADEKSIRREGRMFEMSSRTKTWHHRHIHMYNKNHIKLNEPDVFWSQWSFSADMVVLQPEQSYLVSVFNIPKPEVGHSNYDVSKKVSVPGEETTKESCFGSRFLYRLQCHLMK